jgi:16S rRNA (cytosine967-C5)-methyltransferase
MPISPARVAAFDILLRVERDQSFASELLHSTTYQPLSIADHALATELVMGVLRWRSRLDHEISSASSQPLAKLDLEILIALRLALYQLRWLDRIPARAALHESVELVKRARKRSAASFVNAVLRKLSTTPNHSSTAAPDETSPGSIALAFAHPHWMVDRWVHQYGSAVTGKICHYNQSVPETAIRLRDPEAENLLVKEGVHLVAGAFLTSARRIESGDITKTKALRDGIIIIQDEASQLVAALAASADSNAAIRILDCCAAPGGKTLAIADQNPRAHVIAVELHPHRARLLQRLLRTSHPAQVQIAAADARRLPFSAPVDRILADVPCSGTGTLARNPEI